MQVPAYTRVFTVPRMPPALSTDRQQKSMAISGVKVMRNYISSLRPSQPFEPAVLREGFVLRIKPVDLLLLEEFKSVSK